MEHSLHGEMLQTNNQMAIIHYICWISVDLITGVHQVEEGWGGGGMFSHHPLSFLMLMVLSPRPLSSPLGTICLNHILEKIIPGMKVLLGFSLVQFSLFHV